MIERKWVSKEEAKEMFPDYHDRTLHMPCNMCGNIDVILEENAKTWICPFCDFMDKNEKCFQENLTVINKMYKKLDDLNTKCEDNLKRLNNMMLELKGIIAMVRPMAKKNDWYGKEIDSKSSKIMSHPMPNEVKELFCPTEIYINPDPRKD